MGRHEKALADFTRAIDLDPGLAWAIVRRGDTYQAMGRHEDALADFTRAIDLDPTDAWAIADRGDTYQAMGRREEALADFTSAIDLDPTDAWAIANRGDTYQAMGRHEEALADFTRAIDLAPDLDWAIVRRGDTYWAMDRREEALADYTHTMDLNPDPERWDARILLEVAEPILASADIRQALEQSGSDAEELRKLITAHSYFLIFSASALEFVERLSPFASSRRGPRILTAAIATLALFASSVIGAVGAASVALFILAVLIASLTGYMVVSQPHMPLEPTERTRHVLAREVVGPFLREQINRILAEQKRFDVMRVTSAPGLAELSDRERLVRTETARSLDELTQTMSSGSIGVSGPRGVGKTTLLRSFCDPSIGVANSKDVQIMVTAPVEYNTRDFILHLFEKLCETVLGDKGDANSGHARTVVNQRTRRPSLVLAGCLLAVFGIGLIVYVLLRPKHPPRLTVSEEYLAVGVISVIVGIVILAQQSRLISFPRLFARNKRGIIGEASDWLMRIRYMQTLTTGYSSSIRIPVGAEIGKSATRQLAELQLTLPELVDRYKDFALRVIMSRPSNFSRPDWIRLHGERLERAVNERQSRAELVHRTSIRLTRWRLTPLARLAEQRSTKIKDSVELSRAALKYLRRPGLAAVKPRIVIGIDEIDRMSAGSAERFLSDIKAIFGIPRCLYLVSVSDEALAVFEQRVLHGRSVFDSTFDEVVRVRELDFNSCQHLLRKRIAGMPDALIAFCQVMSGGLPRDLIRMARLVVETCAQGQEQIPELTLSVVLDQIAMLKRSVIAKNDEYDGKYSTNLIVHLVQHDWPGTSVEAVLAAIETDMDDARFPFRFGAALFLYATVAEIFGDGLKDTVRSLRNYRSDEATRIDHLANARNMLSVNAELAWQLITAFRGARGLCMLNEPQSL